jgi:adenylate cyclase
MTERVKRRLTTVLCADVHGYTRLMQADEAGTLSTLRRYRAAMEALVERHDGRVINTWGDAVIAEFSSVVEAVQCAIETQQELAAQDALAPEPKRMRFRIGINLGDVMVDGEDIYGDGVNIAARLQELAEPGGILISGPVYDQVHSKLSVGFDYLGPQTVKNISSPVPSYRVDVARSGDAPRVLPAAWTDVDQAAVSSPESANAIARQWSYVPRPIQLAVMLSTFLFLVNAFSGFRSVWFHWPTLSVMFVAVFITWFRRKRPE